MIEAERVLDRNLHSRTEESEICDRGTGQLHEARNLPILSTAKTAVRVARRKRMRGQSLKRRQKAATIDGTHRDLNGAYEEHQ